MKFNRPLINLILKQNLSSYENRNVFAKLKERDLVATIFPNKELVEN